MATISIPCSIKIIGELAFVDCFSFTSCIYAGSQSQWDTIEIQHGNIELNYATVTCTGPALEGFIQESNGLIWYENDNRSYETGIVSGIINGKKSWYYIENGVYTKKTTLAGYADKRNKNQFYIVNGTIKRITGLVKVEKEWIYVSKGKFTPKTGFVNKVEGNTTAKYFVVDGKLLRQNRFVNWNNKLYAIKDGRRLTNSGMVKLDYSYFYLKNGILIDKTGWVKTKIAGKSGTYYLKHGQYIPLKYTFPTMKSLGLSTYGTTIDEKLNWAMNDMVQMLAYNKITFNKLSAYEKANHITWYIGTHYSYNNGSYTAESMLDKGYGTCFAYSDLVYCMARKAGLKNVWLTKAGRHVNHGFHFYGSQHRSVVIKIGSNYYDMDANLAMYTGYSSPIEKISKSYAMYLIGKSATYTSFN